MQKKPKSASGMPENWRDLFKQLPCHRARDRSTGVAGFGGEQGTRRFARASSEALDTPSGPECLEQIGVSVVAPERRSPEYLEKFIVIVREIEKMG
jgi:hypothetical protein